MEKTAVQHLARVLRILVVLVLALNLFCLLLVPGISVLLREDGELVWMHQYIKEGLASGYAVHTLGHVVLVFLNCVWGVWTRLDTALLTLFYWLCGACTAVILWQAKRVLDTILAAEPFQPANAVSLKRAAICCWVISGGALARLVLWLWSEQGIAPLFTYNALFIPAFLMAGLLFLVMSALFRQAAELKEDQDLTI